MNVFHSLIYVRLLSILHTMKNLQVTFLKQMLYRMADTKSKDSNKLLFMVIHCDIGYKTITSFFFIEHH